MDLDWKDSRGNSRLLRRLGAYRGTSPHSPCRPAPRSSRGAQTAERCRGQAATAPAPGEQPGGPSGTRITEASTAGWVLAAALIRRSCCGVRVGCEVGCFGRWFMFYLVRPLGLAAVGFPPHVTSREAGETRSHSSRERRLCHCSTAVRCAFSMRRQWLDSGAPVEYCPITILPMKSLLLFTLCPYTGESRNREWSRQKHHSPTQSPAPGTQMSYKCPPTPGARCQHFWCVTRHLKKRYRNRGLEVIK